MISAWSVKIRRAPSRHCRDARVCDIETSAIHDMSTLTQEGLWSYDYGHAQTEYTPPPPLAKPLPPAMHEISPPPLFYVFSCTRRPRPIKVDVPSCHASAVAILSSLEASPALSPPFPTLGEPCWCRWYWRLGLVYV